MSGIVLSNAYYKGGVFRGNTPQSAKLVLAGKDFRGLSPADNILITNRCAYILGRGKIQRLLPDAVVLLGGTRKTPPSIFVRTSTRTWQIFLSQLELDGLAEHYGIPAEVLNGAFFSLAKGTLARGINISLDLSWKELFDPSWRKAYSSWVGRKGSLPETRTLRCEEMSLWETLEDSEWQDQFSHQVGLASEERVRDGMPWEVPVKGRLLMPALMPVLGFVRENNGIPKSGELKLREIHGAAIAYFQFTADDSSILTTGFSLFPDQVRNIGKVEVGESLDIEILVGLLASSGASEYCFARKTTGDRVMRLFHSHFDEIEIRGTPTANTQLEPNRIYHWRVVRQGENRLFVYCYAQEEMEPSSLRGVGHGRLYHGDISGKQISLMAPNA
ncbi:MAG: hypothetical protein HQ596_02410 [Candidatus Saganbacteria bacterium]|nr:hypothetical protein [Candidatus Saganbacteria bacterium]